MKQSFFFGWRRRVLISVASGLLSFSLVPNVSQAQEPNSLACKQELVQDIDRIINSPRFSRSRWGIAIQNMATGETIYDLDGDKFFVPASTVKLLTTAAALKELGEDFRITTPIYAEGELPNLKTVRVRGKGDPTITRKILANIVQQFKFLGIESIEKLIIDDSYFAEPMINPTWEWGDSYYYYATAVNSLILEQNTARLTLLPQQIGEPVKLVWEDINAARQWQVINRGITTQADRDYTVKIDGLLGQPVLNIQGELPQDKQEDIWDLAILDPATYFLETFRGLLTEEGITVNRGLVVKEVVESNSERIIAQMYSPPLAELITEINRESNNLYAEVLLKILAKELNYDLPIEALEHSLNKLGLDSKNYHVVDGSGLSRHNLATPQVFNRVLTIMAADNNWDIYRESLAVAGTNGTLKNRLQNTKLQGYVFGKTGSLSGVITFAGYVELRKNTNLAVSVLVNNFDDKNKIVRQEIDKIILLLSQLKSCH